MKYILRLDDACEKRNIDKWDRIEVLLDKYTIKPLVGVIPHCEDTAMDKYPHDLNFWHRVHSWGEKEWTIAMHGYNHVFKTTEGGLNPINFRSEFAGEPILVQEKKIKKGIKIFREHGIEPKVFFAPGHTFDENTLNALKKYTHITHISDTIANKPYAKYNFTFVPQQSGRARALPFKVVTFCYHPNVMSELAFEELENFLIKHADKFIAFPLVKAINEKKIYDFLLSKIYFLIRKTRTHLL